MFALLTTADPAVAAIPVQECGEPLTIVNSFENLRVDTRQTAERGSRTYLRRGVAQRLVAAQSALPAGLQLLVVEGHRSIELQRRYYDAYREYLHRTHPSWPAEYIDHQVSWYIAPPEFAPHAAGAAVDLTLCTVDGDELPMGCPVNASPEERERASYADAGLTSAEHAENRQILVTALSGAGLVNYPSEWWHWSFGDRYWACVTGAPAAIYGPLTVPEDLV